MKALEISNLKKIYQNGFEALKGVSLDVAAGDFFSLLGPNGAGKSTLINVLTTLIKPTSGDIKIYAHSLRDELNQAKACIGLVPQEVNLAIFEKCQQILIQAAGYYGVRYQEAKKRSEKYLKALSLWDKRNTQARRLSGGMKRRLMIARALMHEPKLLILDEPTAGVDIEIRRSMWEFLQDVNASGTTIILTTHYLEEAENLCRNVAMINHGNIVRQGAMKEFLSEIKTQTFVFEFESPIGELFEIEHATIKKLDSETLEVEIDEHLNLNNLFECFNEKRLKVKALRNKASRLEELFIRLATQEQK
jgi:ABC-2 type transport system ATP-binding protein